MPEYSHEFIVNAPIERVAQFHHDTRALKWLSPPPILVQFHRVDPLGEGSIAEFTLWLGPLPIRWKALHEGVTPGLGFSDIQVKGPFKSWKHRHDFAQLDDGHTRVTDTIEAEHSNHLIWSLVSRLMWLNLPILFAYRAWQTRRLCEAS
jgi:ligand-binding SRPBCC domain-containing protein